MRRAVLLLLAIGVLLPSACARPQPGGGPSVVLPTGAELVVEWAEEGGFVSPGSLQIRPPRLAVYADGTTVADADKQLILTTDEVTSLVAQLRQAMSGLPETVESHGALQVADATTTALRVRHDDGTLQTVKAYALTIVDGYPAPLVAVTQRVQALWERIEDTGSEYTADRVKVIAEPRGEAGSAPAWPATIPPPPSATDPYGSRVYELREADAEAVRAQWPSSYPRGATWPQVTLPDGTVAVVAWRYLLPHE